MPPIGTILIADDEPEIMYILTELLVDANYQVRQVHTGLEAVAFMLTERPGLALIDLRWGGMSSLDVILTVRAQGSAVPVVIMTTNHEKALALEAYGATACLGKPFNITDVLTCVAHHIQV